jgi:hypothetical protein
MITVIGSHEVMDFAAWKEDFDEHEPARSAAGVTLIGIYTAVSDPNHVTMIMEFPGLDAFHGFTGDPEVQARMAKAGVVGRPEFKLLNKV